MSDINDSLYVCRLLYKFEQFDDSFKYITEIITKSPSTFVENYDFFAIVMKSTVDPLRNTIFSLDKLLHDPSSSISANCLNALTEKRKCKTDELKGKCTSIIALIDDHLLHVTESNEFLALINRDKGNYYRYIVESCISDKRDLDVINQAKKAYSAAVKHINDFPLCHPTRLSISLSYSVFLHETLKSPEKAVEILKEIWEKKDLSNLSPTDSKNAQKYLESIKNNLDIWG